jgi:hypothetical protein
MARAASWSDLYRIEPFGHSWLPASLKGTSSTTKALILIWLVFGALPVAAGAVAVLLDGTLYLEGEARGVMEDWFTIAFIITAPILASAMAIVFPKLPEVLFTLQNVIAQAPSAGPAVPERRQPTAIYPRRLRGSPSRSALPAIAGGRRLSAKDFNRILKRHERTILGKNNSKYLAMALFVGFVVWAGLLTWSNWFAFETYGYDGWVSRHHMAGFVVVTIYNVLITAVAGSFVTFKFVTITHVMRSICMELTTRGVIIVRPMNPDKAGGLGAIGKFSLQMVLILAVPLFMILTVILTATVTLAFLVSLSFYIPLLVFAFFYPLGGAHQAMNKAKTETLRLLSGQFNTVYDDFMADMKTKRPGTLRADFELADNVDRLYVKAQQMPVWPFNLVTLGRFGGVLLTVTLTVWLKFIIGWFSGVG